MTTFYKNYISLCAQKKKSASAVAVEIGLSRTSPNGWKKGKTPSDINLEKLANYFGVSVDDLVSEQKEKSPTPESAELDETTMKIFKIIDEASPEKRKKILAAMQFLDSLED